MCNDGASREAEWDSPNRVTHREVSGLKPRETKGDLEKEKVKYRELWRLNCQQFTGNDDVIACKKCELESLESPCC